MLSLAWAIAQLGWVVGPAVMVLFAFVNLYTSNLLSQCYRSGDPVTDPVTVWGPSHMDAVKAHLGKGTKLFASVNLALLCSSFPLLNVIDMIGVTGGLKVMMCGLIQYINLFGVAIGYTIAASVSMM